ncbi:hypothetical protein [Companilactobacillus bobalius]|uniref:Uncharacterized protein n=1 Tax=Companilactobacillus bobalius TaxID=2801451 RepID=A0A202F6U0_9LACO|nr:hypothetical protein [Companilactobacillus bobalius]KAE9558479.1 hypothetical protein ATN92_13900 [Companilactobacillus bobalius]OVE96148.1 hypothetical protein LKACC16343_02446 [Companilactobacillus bobalius]GEO58171.1 hypothetical protein LBO01_13000 [Companilactobacillus paralimentarius]
MDYIEYIDNFKLEPNQSFISNVKRFYQETETISTFHHGQMVAKEAVSLSKKHSEQTLPGRTSARCQRIYSPK